MKPNKKKRRYYYLIAVIFVFSNCNNVKMVKNNNYQIPLENQPISHVFNLNIDTVHDIIKKNFKSYKFIRGIGKIDMEGDPYFSISIESIENCYFHRNYFYNEHNKNNFYCSNGLAPIFPSDIYYSKRTKKPLDCMGEFSIDLKKISDTSTLITINSHNFKIISAFRFIPGYGPEGQFYSRAIIVDAKCSPNYKLEILSALSEILGDKFEYKPIAMPKIYVSRNGKHFYCTQ